jgi:hypothetical protein
MGVTAVWSDSEQAFVPVSDPPSMELQLIGPTRAAQLLGREMEHRVLGQAELSAAVDPTRPELYRGALNSRIESALARLA